MDESFWILIFTGDPEAYAGPFLIVTVWISPFTPSIPKLSSQWRRGIGNTECAS